MANNTSQEQFTGQDLPEDTGVNEFGFALGNNNDLQQNPQLQVQSENELNSLPAYDIQGQGMWTVFEAGTETYNQLSGRENFATPNQTSSLYTTDVEHSYPANSCPGSEILAINLQSAPNYASRQASFPGEFHDFSSQELLPSVGNFQSHQQLTGGLLGSEQSQLSQFPTAAFSDRYLQQVPMIPSGFSQLHNSEHVGIYIDSQVGNSSFPQWDLTQLSSSSYSSLGTSAVATLGFDCNSSTDTNPHSQPTNNDMGFQWPTGHSLVSGSITGSSTEPMQGLGTFENPIEITEALENPPKGQISSTIYSRKRPFPEAFGPSHPIALPPARKGGRKGPLSASELKSRRESRKQGVCIRCRELREKCYDGFPCKRCRENPNATFWKFPCTKAEFLGLLECGSCFEDMEVFQTYVVEKIDEQSFFRCVGIIRAMITLGHHSSKIIVRYPRIVVRPIELCWTKALEIFAEIHKLAINGKTSVTGCQFINTPYRLAQIRVSQFGSIFHYVDSFKPESKWVLSAEGFSPSNLVPVEIMTSSELLHGLAEVPENEMAKISENNAVEVFENTVKLCAWISRRYDEVLQFRFLQDASNRLRSLSANDLLKAISVLLHALRLWSMKMYRAEDSFVNQIGNSRWERRRVCNDRKQNMRQALFIYLSIAIDKLPAWYDFWSLERPDWNKASPKIAKHHFTDLEAFDMHNQREITRAIMHITLLHERKVGSKEKEAPLDEEQYYPNTAVNDFELDLGILDEILNGPRNVEAELEAIWKRLSTFYQPLLEKFEDSAEFLVEMKSKAAPDLPSSLHLQVAGQLVQTGRHIQENLEKQLGKLRSSENSTGGRCDAENLIKEAGS